MSASSSTSQTSQNNSLEENNGGVERPSVPRETLIQELNKLEPYERLKRFANVLGIKINPPNKDCPVCKGNGYTEVKENGEVVPCMCIYPGFAGVKPNRAARRKLARRVKGLK